MFPFVLIAYLTSWNWFDLAKTSRDVGAHGLFHNVRMTDTGLCLTPLDNPLYCVPTEQVHDSLKRWPQAVLGFTVDPPTFPMVEQVILNYYKMGLAPEKLIWIAPYDAFLKGDIDALKQSPWKNVKVIARSTEQKEHVSWKVPLLLSWGTVPSSNYEIWWESTEPIALESTIELLHDSPASGFVIWPTNGQEEDGIPAGNTVVGAHNVLPFYL